MRTSLLGGLIANVRYNHARKVPRIRVFEVGRAFLRDPAAMEGPLAVRGVRQPMRLGGAAYGGALEEQWGAASRPVDFYDVKADVESLAAPLRLVFEPAAHPAFHPGRSARIHCAGQAVGWLGELHPRWQRKYDLPQRAVLFELDAEPLQQVPLPAFFHPSKYPAVIRDIAVVVADEVPAQALLRALRGAKPAIVRDVTIFDVYQGQNLGAPGLKSLAFRVVMQHTERTLTDAEADAARDELVVLLQRNFSATLRR